MAVASLVLGIIGLVATFLGLGGLAAILGIVGIILGAMARKNSPNGQNGTATAGLVLSIITVAWGLLSWILCAACYASVLGSLS